MPCRDPGSDDWVYGGRDRKLDELTRMLCGLCKEITAYKDKGFTRIDAVPGLREWWIEHQEVDRKRIAAEKAAKKAERERDEKEFNRLKKKLGISS